MFSYYSDQIQRLGSKLFELSALHPNNSLAKLFKTAYFIAWRDRNSSSSQSLKWEESVYKQYRHELKKYNKKHNIDDSKSGRKGSNSKSSNSKTNTQQSVTHIPPPPPYKRPPVTAQFEALSMGFPFVSLAEFDTQASAHATVEKASKPDNSSKSKSGTASKPENPDLPLSCRMMYKSIMLTNDVQLIVLDMRRMGGKTSLGSDYLGKEQAEWLQFSLQASQCHWKIICCGKSFGICATEKIQKERSEELINGSQDDALAASASGELKTSHSADGLKHMEPIIEPNDDASVEGDDVNEAKQSFPSSRKGSLKQVQLNVPENDKKKERTSHTNLYDDCDEHFSRSKYSLQHVLAEYESKFKEAKKYNPVLFSEDETRDKILNSQSPKLHHIQVASGVVVVSGGHSSFWTIEEEISENSIEIDYQNISDILAPAYCSAYYNLNSPISKTFSLVGGPKSSQRGNIAFCVEVGLGNFPTSNAFDFFTQHETATFHYLQGFDAYTYFSQTEVRKELDESYMDSSFSWSEFHVLPDSTLRFAIYTSKFSNRAESDKELLYSCVLTVPHLAEGSEEQSVDSVFMV